MKIPSAIEPIAHISPYRRIDPSHPGRKRVITLDEWQASGSVGRLRRKLGGCDTRPFAPLPVRRPGRSKACHERLVAKIQVEEQAIVEHLGSIVHDLRRRIRVRKAREKW